MKEKMTCKSFHWDFVGVESPLGMGEISFPTTENRVETDGENLSGDEN